MQAAGGLGRSTRVMAQVGRKAPNLGKCYVLLGSWPVVPQLTDYLIGASITVIPNSRPRVIQ